MRLLLSSLFFLLLTSLAAQNANSYQRTYFLGDSLWVINFDAAQGTDGSFYLLDGVYEDLQADNTAKSMVLSSFTNKGDHKWSREITYNIDRRVSAAVYDVVVKDEQIFVACTPSDITQNNKVIVAFGTNGEVLWQNSYGIDASVNQTVFGANILMDHTSEHLLQTTVVGDDNNPVDLITAIDYDGAALWSRSIAGSDSEGASFRLQVTAINSKPDSSIVTAGLNTNNGSYFLSELDSVGVPVFAVSPRDTNTAFPLYVPTSVAYSEADTSYVVSGQFYQFNPVNPAATIISGFVAKHDSLGRVSWSQFVNDAQGIPNFMVDDMVIEQNGDIVLAGEEALNGQQFDQYMIKLDAQGNWLWGKEYTRIAGALSSVGGLLKSNDGGYARTSTVIRGQGARTQMTIIKTDINGNTSCQDSILDSFMANVELVDDTLFVSTSLLDTTEVTDYPVEVGPMANGYNTPRIPLEIDIFCPNEAIDWTYDATMQGAVAYEWNTGDTTAMLRVMDDETYKVTVTFDEEICYTLCDSATLRRYETPSIELQQQLGSFCDNGQVTIIANYTPGAGAPKPDPTFTWSTGQTGVLRVESNAWDQEISITVVDGCEETATASLVVGEPQLINSIDINENVGVLCDVVTGELLATADAPISSTTWSTGSTSNPINPTSIGTYAVTVTDICNNTFADSVSYEFVPSELSAIEIATEGIEMSCDSVVAGKIVVTGNGAIGDVTWNSGETNVLEISPDLAGEYTVVVSDACDERQYEAAVTIDPVLSDITFPKVFMPRAMEPSNAVFRGYNQCGEEVQGYELHVFNRWGQEVFSTRSIDGAWDGTDGTPEGTYPPDVYVWYAVYNNGTGQVNVKGDVTLLR